MSVTHTPAPWSVDALGSDGSFEIWYDGVDGCGTRIICSRNPIEHRADESRANARLIAKAPNLLQLLKQARFELFEHLHPDTLHEIDAVLAAATAPSPDRSALPQSQAEP